MQTLMNILLSILACAVPLLLLGVRWCLPLRAVLSRIVALGLLNGLAAAIIGLSAGTHWGVVLLGNWALLLVEVPASILPFFYRDPERTPPRTQNLLLSPADGTIVYVKKIDAGSVPLCEKGDRTLAIEELADIKFLPSRGHLIGIAMNFLDVHVNRAPLEGVVRLVKRVPGRFNSLRIPESIAVNERQTILIEGAHASVVLIQIASRLVRRIVAYVSAGQPVAQGQRIGMIKFGSQVDVVLRDEDFSEILVAKGNRVLAGETPIARLKGPQ